MPDQYDGELFKTPLPRLRRAEMIARPARVRMRRRNPWVRLRRRLLGWKVRLLTEVLPVSMSCGTDTPTPDARRFRSLAATCQGYAGVATFGKPVSLPTASRRHAEAARNCEIRLQMTSRRASVSVR